MPAEGLALVALALALIALGFVSWQQGDMIRTLQRKVKAIEDDRADRKDSVLYTRPIRIVPPGSDSNAATRRELRRSRGVDGK